MELRIVALVVVLVCAASTTTTLAEDVASECARQALAAEQQEQQSSESSPISGHVVQQVVDGSDALSAEQVNGVGDVFASTVVCALSERVNDGHEAYRRLDGPQTDLIIGLTRLQQSFRIEQANGRLYAPFFFSFEWGDPRVNASRVLSAAYGEQVLRRLRALHFRRARHKFAIWMPQFFILHAYRGERTVESSSSLDSVQVTNLNGRRPDAFRFDAQVPLDGINDCQMESRRFPFDSTQCIAHVQMAWIRGVPFAPSAPGLPSWYRNAEKHASNVSAVEVRVVARHGEISDDEEWRHRKTGAFCTTTLDQFGTTKLDCYFLMRYDRISEKYIYPWLVTTNILGLASIVLTYKGSDPGEHYSLGAASLVPGALFLFELKNEIPMGAEGYPVIGYYNLAIFVNVILAMTASNLPRWSARKNVKEVEEEVGTDEPPPANGINQAVAVSKRRALRRFHYHANMWADVALMSTFLLIQAGINAWAIAFWSKIFDSDADLSDRIEQLNGQSVVGGVYASDFASTAKLTL